LDRLSGGAMHQGAICSAPPLKIHRLADALEHSRRLVLTLDGIQDPQNFGAVVRSAVGLGKVPVVFGENSSAPLTPATFRASAGAVEHALLCRVPSLAQALLDGELAGFQVLGLDAHGDRDLRDCDLTLSTMLVLGGEGRGLSRGLKRHCSALVRLVSPDVIDSLNASVASAIALYEVLTQRARASNAPTFSA
jgi:23S rRNA (guanosine2251-2'-O)-methyltransferase